MLVEYASHHIQHMQKALTQMNVKLQHVISNITGKTGMAIIEAIVAGERNPRQLARLRDKRIRADEATIAKSLQGHWREEHIFELTQALELYRFYQGKIAECDREIEAQLGAPKAITATAHKLARLIYSMLRYGQDYVDVGAEYYENQYQQRALRAAQRRAAQLGYRLAPMSDAPEHATHAPPAAPIAA